MAIGVLVRGARNRRRLPALINLVGRSRLSRRGDHFLRLLSPIAALIDSLPVGVLFGSRLAK